MLLETAEPFVFLSIGTTCRVCTYSEIGNSAGSRSANLGTSGTDSKTFAAFSRFLLSKSMSSNAKILASWKYNSTGILRVSECRVSGSNSTCTTSRRGASWHQSLPNEPTFADRQRTSARVSGRKRLVLGRIEAGNPGVCPLCPIKPLDEGYRLHSGVLCSASGLPAACCAAQHIMASRTAGSGVSFFTVGESLPLRRMSASHS